MAGAPCRQASEAHQNSLAQCSVMVQCAEVRRRLGTGVVVWYSVQVMTWAHSPHVIVRSQQWWQPHIRVSFEAWNIEAQTLICFIFLFDCSALSRCKPRSAQLLPAARRVTHQTARPCVH